MQLIFFITLSSQHRIVSIYQSLDLAWYRYILQRQAEVIITQLDDSIIQSRCLMSASHDLAALPCSGILDDLRYDYGAERLGNDPCSCIEFQNNQCLTADFYRITLHAYSLTNPNKTIRLQDMVASNSERPSACKHDLHKVVAGRQTRHLLTS